MESRTTIRTTSNALEAIGTMILAALWLAGCGGGGGSSGPASVPPPPPPPPPPPVTLSISGANATAVAKGIVDPAESMLMLADEAAFAVQHIDGTKLHTHPNNCGRGTASYSLQDSDGDGAVTPGDSVTVTYTDCETNMSNGRLQGAATVRILAIDNERGRDVVEFTGILSGSQLTVSRDSGDVVELLGTLEFEYKRGVYESSLTVRSTSATTLEVGDEFESVFRGFEFSKTEYYESASYEIALNGTAASVRFGGDAVFSTLEPLTGPLNTYPIAGVLEVSGGDNSKLRLQPDDLNLDSYALHLDPEGDGTFVDVGLDMPWSTMTAGHLWWYELSSFRNYFIRTYDPNDFRILNHRPFDWGTYGREKTGVNPVYRVQTSRAIDPSTVPASLTFARFTDDWPHDDPFFEAPVEVRGAMLIARPNRQMSPGSGFKITESAIQFSDMNGNAVGFSEFDSFIQTEEMLFSVATPEEGYGFPGDAFPLSAESSMDLEGGALSFEWEQVDGTAVTIDDANSATPTVTLPTVSAAEMIRLRLRTTNQFGEYDYAKTDLTAFPSIDQIDVAIVRGLRHDGTKHEVLYTPANGVQTHWYNGFWAVQIENDTDYVIPSPGGGGNIGFRRNLDLSFGVRHDEFFRVGSYTDIPQTGGAFEDADMRVRHEISCNGWTGEFHVLEFETGQGDEIDTMAIDFAITCPDSGEYAEISGHVRKSSAIAVPPNPY